MAELLIIDDELTDRRLIARLLAEAMPDAGLLEAPDAATGLEMVRRERPDCVLLDLRLPDMDGLAVLSILCDDREGDGSVPVIILTGSEDPDVAMEALRIGAEDIIFKHEMTPMNLYRAVGNAIEKASLRRQLAEAQRLLRQLALFDPLTGLGNRNLFDDQFELMRAGCMRQNARFLFLLIDLNAFKPINDTHGHEAGDMVLMTVAARLNKVCRDADVFFRMGGDEFVGLINTGVSREGARRLAERIGEAVLEPIHFGGEVLCVGCSIGMSLFPDDGDDKETLMRHADHAMYSAKRSGSGFAFHTESPHRREDAASSGR